MADRRASSCPFLFPGFYAPPAGNGLGFLLFIADRQLMAQRFDPRRAELRGDAVPVASPLSHSRPAVPPPLPARCSRWSRAAPTQLAWVDRDGKPLGKLGEPGIVFLPRISPDGRSGRSHARISSSCAARRPDSALPPPQSVPVLLSRPVAFTICPRIPFIGTGNIFHEATGRVG